MILLSTLLVSFAAAAAAFPAKSLQAKDEHTPYSGGELWTYQGCYGDADDRTLANSVQLEGQATAEKCLAACAAGNYLYAGIEYSRECYCGNELKREAKQDPDWRYCYMTCDGNSQQNCGGSWALTLYKFKGTTPGTPTTPTPTPSDTPSTTPSETPSATPSVTPEPEPDVCASSEANLFANAGLECDENPWKTHDMQPDLGLDSPSKAPIYHVQGSDEANSGEKYLLLTGDSSRPYGKNGYWTYFYQRLPRALMPYQSSMNITVAIGRRGGSNNTCTVYAYIYDDITDPDSLAVYSQPQDVPDSQGGYYQLQFNINLDAHEIQNATFRDIGFFVNCRGNNEYFPGQISMDDFSAVYTGAYAPEEETPTAVATPEPTAT